MIESNFFDNMARLHFIGVGGSGMFPLVQIMLARGFAVSGSDNNEGDILDMERGLGVAVYLGHKAEQVHGADAVVYSAAITRDNPELVEARALGIPVIERSELLGHVTSQYDNCICVGGTHGKTSTTAMLTQILVVSGLDPSAVIGGKLPLIGGYGRAGSSQVMTCEACEFVDTFLHLSPDISVILNIDEDHLDYFKTMDNLKRSFRKFAENARKLIVINGEDANALDAVDGLEKRRITFGRGLENDFYPANITPISPIGSRFDLIGYGEKLCTVDLQVLGDHNILNAVAACACALEAGVRPDQLAEGIAGFRGAGRRFEVLGTVRGVTVADDYAHHPAELAATLAAAMKLGFNRVWAVFQPFTYSRTHLLLDEFAEALAIPDRVVMSEIMGGREQNTYNVYTRDLAAKIPGSAWFDTFEEIAKYVMSNAGEGDLVVTLGCGDIYKCAKLMLKM